VDPWGECRADIRAAVNSSHQITASAMTGVSQEAGQELFRMLCNYLEHNRDNEEYVDLAAVQKVREQNGQ
jgi:FPC/CPF motif-containing protein YcgG